MDFDKMSGSDDKLPISPLYTPQSPLELYDSEQVKLLEEDVHKFVKSPVFSENPIKWNDEESFFMAYFAYCEGWGVKKDIDHAVSLLTLGCAKQGPFLMRTLAEHFMYGFYGQEKDIDTALVLFASSFDITDVDDDRAYCAMSISRIYLEHFNTKFAPSYAVPWMKLSLAYGKKDGGCEKAIKEYLLCIEPEVKRHTAADFLREYNRDPEKFLRKYEEHAVTVKGRIGRVRLRRDINTYYAELFPERTSGPQLGVNIGGASCIQCVMEDNEDLFNLSKGDIETIRGFCFADGNATLLLAECELYRDPPLDAPPLPGKKPGRRVIRDADFTPSKKG